MIKKIIHICILSFIFFPININAANKGDVIYSIENIEAASNEIKFVGWAYVNQINTIGGKNYKIYLRAINKRNSEKTDLKESTKYSGGHNLYPLTCYRGGGSKCAEVFPDFYQYDSSGNVIAVTPGASSDKYGLSTPLATCTGEENSSCIHYDPWFEISFSYNDLKDDLEYSEGDEISFEIVLKYFDHGDIPASTSTSDGCRWDYSAKKYKGCDSSYINYLLFSTSTNKTVAFDRATIKKTGPIFSGVIERTLSSSFVNLSNFGKIHTTLYNSVGLNYFEFQNVDKDGVPGNDNEFEIVSSEQRYFSDSDLGIDKFNIRYYKLQTGSNYKNGAYTYYRSGSTGGQYYLPSPWGTASGESTISFFIEEKPEDTCTPEQVKNNNSETINNYESKTYKCDDVDYQSTCNKVISISSMFTSALNEGCPLKTGSIQASKVYKFSEKTEINKGYLFGGNGKNVKDVVDNVKVWPGIKWEQEISWTSSRFVKWEEAEVNKIYYYIVRYYYNGYECTKEEGWLTDSQLNSYINKKHINDEKLNKYMSNASVEIENEADNFAVDRWLNGEKEGGSDSYARSSMANGFRYKLSFPKSNIYNDVKVEEDDDGNESIKIKRYRDYSNIIEVTSNLDVLENVYDGNRGKGYILNKAENYFKGEEKFQINNARINNTDVKYSLTSPGADYTDGGRYYYFAFDMPVHDDVWFGFGLDLRSTIQDMSSYSRSDKNYMLGVWCKLTSEPGNLETMNYRVIDLSNPFPNVIPTIDPINKENNRAVNWYNLWTSSSGFKNGSDEGKKYLYDRTQDANSELYTVNLTPTNIAAIRQYNEEQLKEENGKKTYINAELNDDGTSKFIEDNYGVDEIFTVRRDLSIMPVGEGY